MPITFFWVSRNPEQHIFKVSNAWTNMWNKMMEEKAQVKKQERVLENWACPQCGGIFWSFISHCQFILEGSWNLPAWLGEIEICLSSVGSKIDKQKSRTRSWSSLAWPCYWASWLTNASGQAVRLSDLQWAGAEAASELQTWSWATDLELINKDELHNRCWATGCASALLSNLFGA